MLRASAAPFTPSNKAYPIRSKPYSGLDIRRDPVGWYKKCMDDIRLYLEQNGATTRYLRRKYLYLLQNRFAAAAWLATHPEDLWDTDEEERRGWTHMHADSHAEAVEQHHATTGL